ncbi:NAD-dependent epimerase/dehydratase family protein [Methylobacterium sp. Leaf118]|uniref:NAD-dependent epimerase/dehydratase family protein n=1 Tax=Methylobacterium sp. Leaf118 TaxID=2876562 RepID=UPI001E59B7FD|nr:NAD(P)-dependent oxidoreductase [Methylobacterium sp. Leaf118]
MPIHHRVLLTGAAGALGTELRRDGATWASHLRLTDRIPVADPAAHEEDRPADLADGPALLDLAEGCDAIVHFGGQSREGPWSSVLPSNVVGTYNVYEAARQRGVGRVVYASSIHTVGFHERTTPIDAAAPVRPDSLYGVSKTFGESLSRYYFDKFGIETVCLRIGSCFPEPNDRRHLITWLSYRDLRQLVFKALEAERVGHLIAMPTSDNGPSFWDDRAARILGFRPVDSAAAFRDAVLAATPRGDPDDPAVRFQGGSFCTAGPVDD